MFSQRTQWAQTPNAATQAIGLRRAQGLPILDLTETNPTKVGLDLPVAQIAAALAEGALHPYDPTPFGLEEARTAIAAYHDQRVPPEHIVLTASTSEAYALLFKLLGDPGDRILVPTPSYPLFDYLAALESVQPVPYGSLLASGEWHIDVQALRGLIDARTRAILLVSPNNPTGAVVSEAEVQALCALCRAHDLALISDEVFADTLALGLEGRARSLAGLEGCLTFVLSGLSKVCLQPHLKLGWIAASGPQPLLDEALARLEVLADTYLSVATPVQRALPQLLALRPQIQAQLAARLDTNRRALALAIADSPATLLPSEGGWSAVLHVPRNRSEEAWVLHLLEQDGVLVHPGYYFDFASEAWLVLSLLPEPAIFARGVALLGARLRAE